MSQLPPSKTYRIPPVLPPEIWLVIFEFATYLRREHTIAPVPLFASTHVATNVMCVNTRNVVGRTKCAIVLVSRLWRDIGLRILYYHIDIRSPARAKKVVEVLLAHPAPSSDPTKTSVYPSVYGRWTRHIEIHTYARGSQSVAFLRTLLQLFLCCPSVRMLSATFIQELPVDFVNVIGKLYGDALEGLRWNNDDDTFSPSAPSLHRFLGSFASLRVLDVSHFLLDSSPPGAVTSRIALHRVEELVLSIRHHSLSTAKALALPNLKSVVLKGVPGYPVDHDKIIQFLKVHGALLISVDLYPSPICKDDGDLETVNLSFFSNESRHHIPPSIFLSPGLCPSLTTLVFNAHSPLLESHSHSSLRFIGLRGVKSDTLYPAKMSHVKSHLESFTRTRFPNLEVVKTIGFMVDAETDVVIKDIFIWWTEKFEKDGVDFRDGEGVVWLYTDATDMEKSSGKHKSKRRNLLRFDGFVKPFFW
ncbi:hypothetical protein FISHEDRAFT_67445 [Fistulina hepatica ATCC 64428]|uniref:F-box domain-containing protein n=1 Tax=Fistulina hepatica ATCC 64428 TaxID=1128425 RepID=A0A0D7A3Q5_9AGAR|nr:hypothetical protein FISHEDRAFT_67445 [Fistulina hepatica ATCC 64428]